MQLQPEAAQQAVVVTGCQHPTVSQIVRGTFASTSTNHGRPVFKKTEQANGLDVLLYFWDERDGADFCGWYFGMEVGGDQVWAYHPDKISLAPPPVGWKVPYGGPDDPTLFVTPGSVLPAQQPSVVQQQIQQQIDLHQQHQHLQQKLQQSLHAQQPQQPQQMLQLQQQQLQQQQFAQPQQMQPQQLQVHQMQPQQLQVQQLQPQQLQSQQPQPPQPQQPQQPQQLQQLQQPAQQVAQPAAAAAATQLAQQLVPCVAVVDAAQQQAQVQFAQQQAQLLQYQQQQQMLQYQQAAALQQQQLQLLQNHQLAQVAALQQQAAQAAERNRQEELRRKREAEMVQKRNEDKAAIAILTVAGKFRGATPENFDALCEELDQVMQKELGGAGSQQQRVATQAEQAKASARRTIDIVVQRRKQHEDMVNAENSKRREMDERAQILLGELDKLVSDAQVLRRQLTELSIPLKAVVEDGEAPPSEQVSEKTDDEAQAAARAVEIAAGEVEELARAGATFVQLKDPELSGLQASLTAAPRFPSDQELVTKPAEIPLKLRLLRQEMEDLKEVARTSLEVATATGEKVGRRIAARRATEQQREIFQRYDKDGDKLLSKSEVRAYSKGEFNFAVPKDALTSIWTYIVHENGNGEKVPGVAFDMFQQLKIRIGVAREIARDRTRRAFNDETEKALVGMCKDVEERLRPLVEMVAQTEALVAKCEEELKGVQRQTRGVPASEAEKCCSRHLKKIAGARSSWQGSRAALDSLSNVEKRYRPGILAFLEVKAKAIERVMGQLDLRLVRVTNITRRIPDGIREAQARKERKRRKAQAAAKAAEDAEREIELQIEEQIRVIETADMEAEELPSRNLARALAIGQALQATAIAKSGMQAAAMAKSGMQAASADVSIPKATIPLPTDVASAVMGTLPAATILAQQPSMALPAPMQQPTTTATAAPAAGGSPDTEALMRALAEVAARA